jgi:L-aspartate oxidase
VEAERRAGRGAFLDARAAVGARFPAEFPAVFAACQKAGIDPRTDLAPVAAGAHYHMGGVKTDVWGRTSLDGLYAAGECAGTGVHGANRLASNSLVEAAVFGRRAGEAARDDFSRSAPILAATPAPDLAGQAMTNLRLAMARDAGITRDGAGLGRLLAELEAVEAVHGAALPLVAARLVADAALARRESRGGHFRRDFPRPGPAARHAVVTLQGARAKRAAA